MKHFKVIKSDVDGIIGSTGPLPLGESLQEIRNSAEWDSIEDLHAEIVQWGKGAEIGGSVFLTHDSAIVCVNDEANARMTVLAELSEIVVWPELLQIATLVALVAFWLGWWARG